MRFGIQTLVMIALSAPAFATETHCKGNEANLRMVEEMTEVLFNKRDEAQAPKYYAPEVISHNADRGGGETQRVPIATMQKMWRDSKANSPDRKLVNDLIICADDLVVVRVTLSATMSSPMGNIPANGKKYTTTATPAESSAALTAVAALASAATASVHQDLRLFALFARSDDKATRCAAAGAPLRCAR